MFKATLTLAAALALTACGSTMPGGPGQTTPPQGLTLDATIQGPAPQAVRLLLVPGKGDIVGTLVAEAPVVNNTFSLSLPTGAPLEPFLKTLTFGNSACASQAVVSDRNVRAISVTRFAGVESGAVTGAVVSFEGPLNPTGPATGVVLVYVDRDLTVTGTDVCGQNATAYNLSLKAGWNVTAFTTQSGTSGRWESRTSATSPWLFTRTATPLDKKN